MYSNYTASKKLLILWKKILTVLSHDLEHMYLKEEQNKTKTEECVL